MWFKQVQVYALREEMPYQPEALAERLQPLAFKPCLPTLPITQGWVPPIVADDVDAAPLTYGTQGYQLCCMQIEEKLLPPVVVQQAVAERVGLMEADRDYPVSPREKRSIKEAIILDLLPKSFSKLSKVYAYIDTKRQWLIVDTAQRPKADRLLALLKRSYPQVEYHLLPIRPLPPLLTQWVLHQSPPAGFEIEKACLLKDPNQQHRRIRCQHQELAAGPIIDLIKAGCQVHELALSWGGRDREDQISFVLNSDMTLKSLRYADAVLDEGREALDETPAQRFVTDFTLMTEALSELLSELYETVGSRHESPPTVVTPSLMSVA